MCKINLLTSAFHWTMTTVLISSLIIIYYNLELITKYSSNYAYQSNSSYYSANFYKNCNYITWAFNPSTGLGNRMFMYASLYGLAKNLNKQPYISNVDYKLDKVFKVTIRPEKLQLEINFKDVGEYDFHFGAEKVYCNKSVRVGGYMQSWRYFNDFKEEIKQEFKFIDEVEEICMEKISNISKAQECSLSNCTFIGAHMRRGDFTYPHSIKFGHQPATKKYLQEAISSFDSVFKHNSVVYVILGNDYEWNFNNSRNITNNKIVVLKPETPGIDLCVLTKCNHTIMSSGTFSWWAAFLTGGIVTYMNDQCRPNSSLCTQFQINDYINPEWKWIPL